MASSATTDGVEADASLAGAPRNPLTCGVCQDYYSEPCLLSCFHTVCARCIRGPHLDGKVVCPICGQITQLEEGAQMPPVDQLICQLVEIANSENPACANCDKRDKSTMFFCTTCGQALCTHCREHTHRAKMFSSHEVVHMSKCSKETQKRCPTHGDLFIMYSQSTKSMLCATCLRDTPNDARIHCVDIDTAWQQASKKMERAANSICELQAGVRDGLLALKSQLDELRHNLDSEKRTLNSYCQGMQDAITKTHQSVSAELQRQFEIKERMVRSQLLSLGSALPVLQMHLMLCTVFTSGATKYQFLELAHPMLERLGHVAQLVYPSRPPVLTGHFKINYRNKFVRVLQPFIGQLNTGHKDLYDHTHQISTEPQLLQSTKASTRLPKSTVDAGPFSSHCRTFDSQLKELSQQLMTVKERLNELHRDVTLLRRANTPPLGSRYDHVARDCRLLEQQLEQHQIELERLRDIFDALWEEQLCKIHIEKEIFHSQMNDILMLRGEVKQLQTLTQQLEPFVKSFSAGVAAGEMSAAAADAAGHQHLQALLDHFTRLQMQEPQQQASSKDCRHAKASSVTDNILYMKESKDAPRSRTPSGGVGALLDSAGNIIVYGTAKSSEAKRGVLSQLLEKARPREDRKKSPGREESRDRSQSRRSRKSPDGQKPKTPPGHSSTSKVRSLYRSLKGGTGGDTGDNIEQEKVPESQQQQQQQQQVSGTTEDSEYQRISDASTLGEAKKSRVQAQIHAAPSEDPNPISERQKTVKVYPASDSEDVFYSTEKNADVRRRRRASCDSISTTGSGSRRSSIVDGTGGQGQDPRKTVLVLIGTSSSKSTPSLVQKQRSWETFPRPKSKRSPVSTAATEASVTGLGPLKKADSFEGHEEAVRTLVAAVQETRVQRHHHAHHHRHHRKSKTN
ncbi:RING finger protein 207-like [Chelonus insularis]|uniref:RING finger protein 207-like n=1 Tax=Chelonus insularis TaxID=460826 RepID=UPI00158C8E56|nr:RING finger protein 207-like [Chelonus insularis]XP_034938050.1 RING finger protein 207-like [Chelonus insularis]